MKHLTNETCSNDVIYSRIQGCNLNYQKGQKMMNYIKIQTDLLKMMDKQSTNKVAYQDDEENVYLTTDTFRIFIIPQKKFFIDLKKLDKPPMNMKKMLYPENTIPADFKGEIRKLLNGRTVRKIEGSKHHAWIDEKLLKEYGNITSYKITDEKSPVYLYENETLLGIILPVYVKGSE